MARTLKAEKANERHSWRGRAETDSKNEAVVAHRAVAPVRARPSLSSVHTRFGTTPEKTAAIPKNIAKDIAKDPAVADPDRLSIRAENVLKELAAELAGETPPKGRWIPSDDLLQKLTFKHLLTARNCGPQTIDEIVQWAATRGVTIQRPFYAGKSLAAMWHDLIAKFSSGEFTKAEIAEALERSMRRKNTKIPVALQSILLQLLMSGN
jgi:hypothetical protein